jgi:hypothetical protein
MTTSFPAALGLALFLAACSGSSEPTTIAPPANSALLRVVNATSGPPISVAVDGQVILEGVTTLEPSAYTHVPTGTHTLEVRSTAQGTMLGTTPVTFRKDSSYTLVAPPAAGGDPVVAIDTGAVPAAGKVKFRVVHGAPDAPPLDVYLTEDGASLDGATPYVTPFVYGTGASSDFPGYVEREPGTYDVRFTAAGSKDVVLDSGPLPAAAGQVFSVVLVQQSDTLGGGLAVQVLRDR